ncbi:MAG: FtsX-like permease family protein [Glaciecola sp.]|jgi:lipoprotein-releasing system permease protein|nr:FtsX-like permease family protein [Glaciecola sp.]MDG1814948.1 FtsX-like permease family protein [Glaciecola sp.]MDG2100696.1 FtsX-like permease family protein [Glaciecola sp.]
MSQLRLAWRLALRFRQNKHDQRFVSFIAGASIAGISLGCAVLILLLSVMNGFERELEQRILSAIPHGELFAVSPTGLSTLENGMLDIASNQNVKAVYAYTQQSSLLQVNNTLHGLSVTGLDLNVTSHPLWQFVTPFNEVLKTELPPIYLGKAVVTKFDLQPGQTIQLLLPLSDGDQGSQQFKAPKLFQGVLAGTIHVGGEADQLLALTSLTALNDSLGITSGAKGLQIYYHDVFAASQLTHAIGYEYPEAVYISDWTRTHGHLYQDIQLVKVIVYIVLLLVIAVASFNILSSLTMAVKNKQAHIAILKTMGASPEFLARVFVLQGLYNALLGIVSGTLIGVGLSLYLSNIIRGLETIFGVAVLSGDIYFIDFLPTQLQGMDVVVTVLLALVLSVLATLYPAKKAANVLAAKFLH